MGIYFFATLRLNAVDDCQQYSGEIKETKFNTDETFGVVVVVVVK